MKINKWLAALIAFHVLWVTTTDPVAAAGQFYYSIHGASYQNLDRVKDAILMLKEKGYDASYDKVDIEGKGRWYRLYIGKYDSKEKAGKVADTLSAR